MTEQTNQGPSLSERVTKFSHDTAVWARENDVWGKTKKYLPWVIGATLVTDAFNVTDIWWNFGEDQDAAVDFLDWQKEDGILFPTEESSGE